MRRSAVLAFILLGNAALAAAPAKPRLNGWLAVYDVARRKGGYYPHAISNIDSPSRLSTVTDAWVWVPVVGLAPQEPLPGNTCRVYLGMNSLGPAVKGIDGFDPMKFSFRYDDKGCTGNFTHVSWISNEEEAGPTQRYMKAWMTPAIYDYIGLLLLQTFRDTYHD